MDEHTQINICALLHILGRDLGQGKGQRLISQHSLKSCLYLRLELKCLPNQLNFLASVVLLHNGETQSKLRHPETLLTTFT